MKNKKIIFCLRHRIMRNENKSSFRMNKSSFRMKKTSFRHMIQHSKLLSKLKVCVEMLQQNQAKHIQLSSQNSSKSAQILNFFTLQSECDDFDHNNRSLKLSVKFQSQIKEIISSDSQYEFQKEFSSQLLGSLNPEIKQRYNKFICQKKIKKSSNQKKSDCFLTNNLSELTSQTINKDNYTFSITLQSLIDSNYFVTSTVITNSSNNIKIQQKYPDQTNIIHSSTNQLTLTTSAEGYYNPLMCPLTFQQQLINFEEEILNQMELSGGSSNNQVNNQLLNSDFQCQMFIDNIQEQMGSSMKQQRLNKHDSFFCLSDVNDKINLTSSSSSSSSSSKPNEFVDSVKKIRQINLEYEQQNIFDIKDFYDINENLFQESKKQTGTNSTKNDIPFTDMSYLFAQNPINNSLQFTNLFKENNQIETLQKKMTEQINHQFLMSCSNLLNFSNHSLENIQKSL